MDKDNDLIEDTGEVPVPRGAVLKPQGSGITRLLRGLKGQRDEAAVFSNASKPLSTSENSSQLAELDDDTKRAPDHATVHDENGLEQYYVPIDTYEGRHRYDPRAQWSPQEEKKLVRKLDYKICAWVCFMFFALQLDRGNINQALSDNFLSERCQSITTRGPQLMTG